MIARLRPAGAVLAALAAWSASLLVLALAGLGGRVGLHEGNAALAPPVPQVRLEAVDSRLGPAADYLDIGNRPLLSPDRRPAPVADAGSGDAPLDADLTSVLIAGDLKLAILQGKSDGSNRRVRLGDLVEGTAWRLVEIEPRRAVFEGPEGRRELALRVFDGQGGEPVTQVGDTLGPVTPTSRARAGTVAPAPEPATAKAADPPGNDAAVQAVPVSPEQQVEAIRRRIEARRAQRAAEAAAEQSAQDGAKQVE